MDAYAQPRSPYVVDIDVMRGHLPSETWSLPLPSDGLLISGYCDAPVGLSVRSGFPSIATGNWAHGVLRGGLLSDPRFAKQVYHLVLPDARAGAFFAFAPKDTVTDTDTGSDADPHFFELTDKYPPPPPGALLALGVHQVRFHRAKHTFFVLEPTDDASPVRVLPRPGMHFPAAGTSFGLSAPATELRYEGETLVRRVGAGLEQRVTEPTLFVGGVEMKVRRWVGVDLPDNSSATK